MFEKKIVNEMFKKWAVISPRDIRIFLLLKFFFLGLQEDLHKIEHI
jgi:hypothetical protein